MSKNNYYDVLQVSRGTDDISVLKRAYKKQMSKYHPDNPENIRRLQEEHPHKSSDDIQQIAEKCTKRVNTAWSTLKDEHKKASYDFESGKQNNGNGSAKKNQKEQRYSSHSSTGDVRINNDTLFNGDQHIYGNLLGSGTVDVIGNLHVNGNVAGQLQIKSTEDIQINSNVSGTVKIHADGDVQINGHVIGNVEISSSRGEVHINGTTDRNVMVNGEKVSNSESTPHFVFD